MQFFWAALYAGKTFQILFNQKMSLAVALDRTETNKFLKPSLFVLVLLDFGIKQQLNFM